MSTRELKVSEKFIASKDFSTSAQQVIKKSWMRLVHGYIRWAIAGGQSGPDGADCMAILGKEETLRRFAFAKVVMEEQMRALGKNLGASKVNV